MSERTLKIAQKAADDALKKQTQEGLYKLFNLLSCKGVAKEIKAGRNVTGNVEFGIRMCIHDRFGPKVDVETMTFHPQTAKSKEIEKKFIGTTNKLLKLGGFRKISPKFLAKLKKKDKAFEQKIKKRRAARRK